MQPTHATRRSRASSDPGTLLSGREDLELQPMGIHAGASVQNAVGEMAATNPPEIAAPPSTEPLQTIAILDPGGPRSTTAPTTPEQEKLVPSAVVTSTSARPSAGETATPGSSEPTLVSGQSGSHHTYFPSQGNGTPGLEDITSFSTEATLMRPLAESSLPSTDQHNTPGQEQSIGPSLRAPLLDSSAEPQVQSSTPQEAPPERGDSAGAAPPITPHAEPETRATAQKNGTPDLESFFEKYKTMVRPSRSDEFRSTLGRERNFRALTFPHNDCKDDDTESPFLLGARYWIPSKVKELQRGILLVEDADIHCVLALDAEFGLDPRFIVRYVDYSHFLEPSHPPFGDSSCCNDAGMAGNWYIISGTTWGAFSRRWRDPSRTAQRGITKFFDRGEATKKKRPWWGEACRRTSSTDVEQFVIHSRIACYCLSDDLRILLVESSPQLATRLARPFDLRIRFGFTGSPALRLPVSLIHLAEGRPFAVFECLTYLLGRLGPSLPGLELELETSTRRELTLSSDGKGFNDREVQRKVEYSMWILAVYQWERNLGYLKAEFTRLRFVALAQPGMRTYLPLIHLRQLIVGMRDRLPDALAYSNLRDACIGPDEILRLSLRPSALSLILTRIAEDLEKLDKELNDEIHLIIGAVTVQDSDSNKEQTERATLLTLLAAVYLPLTLVTGIFGMNIKDISDGNPSWRACGEVLAVVAVCTVVFVVAYRFWRRWRQEQRKKERLEFGFDKDV